MRCYCCNANLSDYEAVLKHPETGEFLDICQVCLEDIPIDPVVPDNVVSYEKYDDDDY